jgi:hypothetical protein
LINSIVLMISEGRGASSIRKSKPKSPHELYFYLS